MLSAFVLTGLCSEYEMLWSCCDRAHEIYYLRCPGSSVKSWQVNWQLERTLSFLCMKRLACIDCISKAVPAPSFLACDSF